MASDTEITKVRIVIRHLLWQIRDVRNDRDAAWEWVNRFANTLQYQDLEQDPDQYALAILAEARSFNDLQQRKQQMRWVRKQLAQEGVTSPTQEQLDEKWLEMYGNEESPQDAPNGNAGVDMSDAGNGAALKSPTSCDTFTADGDTREDSQDRKSSTSADLYGGPRQAKNGDAATREGADVSTTVSRNMRQPAKTRDTRDDSRGRYAPPSCSPEDGNPAETAPSHGGSVASLEAQQSRQVSATADALESQRRAGGSSVRGMAKVAQPPVRSSGPMPEDIQTVYDFAAAENLDPVDAYECWNVTVNERDGRTADGKRITNWKAYVRKWCKTRANNRRTA